MMSEKQLSFDGAMKIVGEQKWIQIKDIERLEKFIQNQQATINKLKEELELTANTKLYSRRELERKVDEQQATISQLQDLCGESDSENAKLRIENKKLQSENEQLKKQLELRTESDKYHQRMLLKWLCKDGGDGV